MTYKQPDPHALKQYAKLSQQLREIIEHSQFLDADNDALTSLLEQTQALNNAFSEQRQKQRWLALYGNGEIPQTSEQWAMRLPYGFVTGKLIPWPLQ